METRSDRRQFARTLDTIGRGYDLTRAEALTAETLEARGYVVWRSDRPALTRAGRLALKSGFSLSVS